MSAGGDVLNAQLTPRRPALLHCRREHLASDMRVRAAQDMKKACLEDLSVLSSHLNEKRQVGAPVLQAAGRACATPGPSWAVPYWSYYMLPAQAATRQQLCDISQACNRQQHLS